MNSTIAPKAALKAAANLLAATLLLAAPLASPAHGQDAEDQIAWTQACEDWDEWDKPAPPFRIFGNSYYVGTCGIGSILITQNSAGILIDSGTRAGADVIMANVASLGIEPMGILTLLTSHEHFDHVGGMAYLQELTGATVIAYPDAAETLRSGVASPYDPQAGTLEAMQPVLEVQPIENGGTFRLTENRNGLSNETTVFTAVYTPGHTPGALSWYWQSCDEAGDCKTIVYADSLSPVSSDDYRFSDHPEYVAAYREGLARLAALKCDILLTPHPSASGMRDKLISGDLASGMNCREYAASVTARLDARLQEEAEAAR